MWRDELIFTFVLLLTDINMGSGTQNTAEQPLEVGVASNTTLQQQMTFVDDKGGESLEFTGTSVSQFDSSAVSGLDLGDFLSRPVLIDTFHWFEGVKLTHNISPWVEYLSNPIIKKKLDNYGLWRCNLKIKIVLSASPFYYGAGLVSYNPLPDSHQAPSIGIDEQLVTYSQRPHIWISASESAGGEMTLPFFLEKNWSNNSLLDIARMGSIRFDSPFALRNANSVGGANITIRTYAWAENMELSAPTVILQAKRSKRVSMQKKSSPKTSQSASTKIMDQVTDFADARDEYGSGPVSNVASAVANAGAALSKVPVIGPFARATEIGAGALSRVAAWFGFTNIPVISNVMPYKDLPFGGFASSEIGAPTPKLTLDPKNELTLDSRTVGLDGTDELTVSSFVTRESYLTYFDWNTSDLADAVLFVSAVSPAQLYRYANFQLWGTPLSHALSMFQFWTGDVIFRFQVVATQYHRGRFKITFEPSPRANDFTPSDETANITRIFDIGETQDIEICVPYMQALAYLPIPGASSSVVFTNPLVGISGVSGNNGYIKVAVVTELTSPIADAPISMIVSVRGGDNLKVMGPRAPPRTSQWTSQAGMNEHVKVDECMGDCDVEEPNVNLVYGGETAMSFRQLMHRHAFVRGNTNELTGVSARSTFYMYPESLNMSNNVKNIHDAGGGNRFNYVANTFVSWLSPCFAGRRGSMYWAVNIAGDTDGIKTQFTRSPDSVPLPTGYDNVAVLDETSTPTYAFSLLNGGVSARSGNGLALSNTKTQTGVTVLCPFISNQRFVGTHPSPMVDATTPRLGVTDHVFQSTWQNPTIAATARDTAEFYCATGPDFNLFFFTGVPTINVGVVINPPV